MAPAPAGRSLHELLALAVERAALAQEESQALADRQRELTEALRETLRQRTHAPRRSETDIAVPKGAPTRGRRSQR